MGRRMSETSPEMDITIVESVNILDELQTAHALGQLNNTCVILHDPTVGDMLHTAYMDFRYKNDRNTEMSIFGFEKIAKNIYKAVLESNPIMSDCYPLDLRLLASLKLGNYFNYKYSENPINVIVYI